MSQAGKESNSSPVLGRQLTTVGAIGASLFLLLKVYVVADFSITTALGLITASPTLVLLGSLTSFIYELMPLLTAVSVVWFITLIKGEKKPETWMWMTIAWALAIVSAALSPWTTFLLALLGSIAFFALLWRARPLLGAGWSFRHSVYVYLAVVLIFGFLRTLGSMWLPPEVIAAKAYPLTIGYVLEEGGDRTAFLRWSDRALIRVPASNVTGRQVCHWKTRGGSRPLYYAIMGRSYRSPNYSCARVIWCLERHLPGMRKNTEPEVAREANAPQIRQTKKQTCRRIVDALRLT